MNNPTSSTTNILGGCIRERTRNLLGWSESFPARMHPYRVRRFSSGSTCSSESSQPSPSSSIGSSALCESPHPANGRGACEIAVFNRIRNLVPTLRQDANAFQILVDSVSNMMDEMDDREQMDMKASLPNQYNSFFQTTLPNEMYMPEDLLNVDVTAFKHLIYSQPVHFSPPMFYKA